MLEKISKKPTAAPSIETAAIKKPVNLVWAIHEFAISDIGNNGRLLSEKAAAQKREQDQLDRQQKRQKTRYDSSANWSFAKILDGTVKTCGLFATGVALNVFGNQTLIGLWGNTSAEGRNTIINGASSVIGQFSGAMEGKHQASIQTTGASEIESARLKQTAASDDKRRIDDYASSSNQTFIQALQKAAESLKPR
jgi:hypothetical protein